MNTSKYYKKIKEEDFFSLRNRNLYRNITHKEYLLFKRKKDVFCKKELSKYPNNLRKPLCNDKKYYERYRIDDKYWEVHPIDGSITSSLIIISSFAFLLSIPFFYLNNEFEASEVLFCLISLFFLIFNIAKKIYDLKYKEEQIYDRLNRTLTFPGVFWETNITMDFNNVKFLKSYHRNVFNITGLNPKILGQSFHLGMYYNNPYEDLTILTWYMDKNRPLPNMIEFKSYHDTDYERRKKEKFPPPLYFSFISITEYTKVQMKEREQFWYDEITVNKTKNIKTTCILRGSDEIFDMKSRTWFKRSEIHKINGVFYSSIKLSKYGEIQS